MKITRDFLTGLSYVIFVQVASSFDTIFDYRYFKKEPRLALPIRTKPVVERFKLDEAYPAPLPTPPEPVMLGPFRKIYQGVRRPNDTRVFRKRFNYESMNRGHHVVFEEFFDCLISHLAIETTEATPVLLRGGAGYRYFTTVIKAKPLHELKGQVRAYCRNYKPPVKDQQGLRRRRKEFNFDKIFDDEYPLM